MTSKKLFEELMNRIAALPPDLQLSPEMEEKLREYQRELDKVAQAPELAELQRQAASVKVPPEQLLKFSAGRPRVTCPKCGHKWKL